MKKLFFGILFATLFTINLNGQQRTYKMKIIAKKNCVFSLQRNIVGIQASAILTVLQFNRKFPNENIKEIKKILNSLAISSKYPSIRVKAQLASMVLNYPLLFANIKLDSMNRDLTFQKISKLINIRLLSSL